jgi:hypothetical protein
MVSVCDRHTRPSWSMYVQASSAFTGTTAVPSSNRHINAAAKSLTALFSRNWDTQRFISIGDERTNDASSARTTAAESVFDIFAVGSSSIRKSSSSDRRRSASFRCRLILFLRPACLTAATAVFIPETSGGDGRAAIAFETTSAALCEGTVLTFSLGARLTALSRGTAALKAHWVR